MIHDILDLHTHTIMSGHAYNTMQEMICPRPKRAYNFFASPNMPRASPVPATRFISSTLRWFRGNSLA